jgi:hypothetical protein
VIVALGMDPGPTPGLVRLLYADDSHLLEVRVVQCSANAWRAVLEDWLATCPPAVQQYFQVERFVIGRKSYRTGSPGAITRDMVGQAVEVAARYAVYTTQRSAVDTKEWGTDGRLIATGLLDDTKGMTHARDAARHALYTAVAEGNIPDPLSKRARNRDG